MSDRNRNDQSEFIIEKIKERPINRKKLMRRTIITAAMAVIFGLIACFTFLVLEPIISNWLYPEEKPQIVLFPEDDEEMSPEEMLNDTMHELQQGGQNPQQQSKEEVDPKPEGVTIEENQVQEILNSVVLDKESYRELYASLSTYVKELNRSMVTITAITADTDWLNTVSESSYLSSGVIIANNTIEFLILTEYDPIRNAKQLMVEFYNGVQTTGSLKQYDTTTDLAIVAVEISVFSKDFLENIMIAQLGSSNKYDMVGSPVVALGNPMGTIDSIGYGVIVGENYLYETDGKYKILQTDIYGSKNAGGVLFNLDGEIMGVITESQSSDMSNLVVAYGISNLRKIIEKLSNEIPIPYSGVEGMDVSSDVNRNFNVPLGAYVKEVKKNSPAMLAGIQQGDIIVGVDDITITNYNAYITMLMNKEAGDDIQIKLMRQSQEEYKEMTIMITLGEKGKEE